MCVCVFMYSGIYNVQYIIYDRCYIFPRQVIKNQIQDNKKTKKKIIFINFYKILFPCFFFLFI